MIASSQEIRPEAVASHYDELDRFYRDIWGEHVHHGLWLRGEETPGDSGSEDMRACTLTTNVS